MNRPVTTMAVLVCGLAWSLAVGGAETPVAEPQAPEAKGIDLGGKTAMVFVARDKATWDAVKQAAGKRQMLPRGMPQGDLKPLDAIDFQKQMIVAVFWGEMAFSGQGEKCWIERVSAGKEEIVVDCQATLWGGAVVHAYRAWPYHAKAVPRSDLPVRFRQTTELKANPGHSEKDKTLAILKATEWKREIPAEK